MSDWCGVNAGESVYSIGRVGARGSAVPLGRRQVPAGEADLSPGRGDPQTRRWDEPESLDLSFHFPGWSPRLECRSLLLQLRIAADAGDESLQLLGVLMRGMTYDGERWRLATVGNWSPEGSHLPQPQQVDQLRQICRDLFELFDGNLSIEEVA